MGFVNPSAEDHRRRQGSRRLREPERDQRAARRPRSALRDGRATEGRRPLRLRPRGRRDPRAARRGRVVRRRAGTQFGARRTARGGDSRHASRRQPGCDHRERSRRQGRSHRLSLARERGAVTRDLDGRGASRAHRRRADRRVDSMPRRRSPSSNRPGPVSSERRGERSTSLASSTFARPAIIVVGGVARFDLRSLELFDVALL